MAKFKKNQHSGGKGGGGNFGVKQFDKFGKRKNYGGKGGGGSFGEKQFAKPKLQHFVGKGGGGNFGMNQFGKHNKDQSPQFSQKSQQKGKPQVAFGKKEVNQQQKTPSKKVQNGKKNSKFHESSEDEVEDEDEFGSSEEDEMESEGEEDEEVSDDDENKDMDFSDNLRAFYGDLSYRFSCNPFKCLQIVEEHKKDAKGVLGMARAFLRTNDTKFASECVWAAAAMTIKQKAANMNPPLRLKSHLDIRKYNKWICVKCFQEPALFIKWEAKIEGAHSQGFYEDNLSVDEVGECIAFAQEYIQKVEELDAAKLKSNAYKKWRKSEGN